MLGYTNMAIKIAKISLLFRKIKTFKEEETVEWVMLIKDKSIMLEEEKLSKQDCRNEWS